MAGRRADARRIAHGPRQGGAPATKVGKPPLRLTRRGRIVLVVGVALLSLGGFWLGTRAVGLASAAPVTNGESVLPAAR
ncbi:hypothetical protein ABT294_32435 [Nonomuraea sp. NPDC000554]|uniref:hypothetical protein n=1 Tax=Nonomuraea sp. NPDC000554 TaxID=3154259 RepID=UPI00331A96DA